MQRNLTKLSAAAFYEFVDNNFLNNKRPPVPGGSWTVEVLRNKSLADLQHIWFLLLKERNMLKSMKEHYLRHQEELGAMPAPSRLKMIDESMRNIKRVVKERDEEATARAVEIFKERLKRGIYRYPPGPPPPPGAHDKTSVVKVELSCYVEEERLRELFGRYDVFEPHKGIVRVELKLPDEVLKQKEEAEQLWTQYMAECSDVKAYHQWSTAAPSAYDYTEVELAPGIFANDAISDKGGKHSGDTETHEGVIVAARVPVPPPKEKQPPPKNPLERLKAERRSYLARTTIQLGYFPNVTLPPPRYETVEAVPRPVHPDEIEGPWEAYITYDREDGLSYAQSLGITTIGVATVLGLTEHVREPQPYAVVDPVYCEALRRERAREETLMKWPHVPEWKYEYSTYTRKHLADIVQYNYTNVVDYVDREVLLTGKSVWECPIHIDHTCGGSKTVPPHAKKPVRYMDAGIANVGVTDI
uniref:uL29m n=1 Tax=Trypanosoma brucei brucei TaxID=5702 RepID=UPI000E6AE3EE|nr:Chain A2, uL29m [Trypanosoma brucei brucei]6HIX_A2 Chain A2, ul29m [Trypanosoma brucei brucei]6YXX_A2 Chain A2, uL29m [Trypanosoma brucei brucei]6YXY_A2 Chain A2, uL29m [Trypanosoma brucei brucei]